MNETTNEKVSKHEIILTDKKSKKGLKTILIIVSALMLIGIVIGIFLWREVANYNKRDTENQYFVFAPALNICEKTKNKDGETMYKQVEQAPFGTVFLLQREGVSADSKNYFRIVAALSDAKKYKDKEYYIETLTDYDLQEKDGYYFDLEKCLKIFPQKEAQDLPSHIKKAITDYINNNSQYYFTQDANRIKSTIVFADFNMDGEQDAAVTMDSEYGDNCLLVLCYNKDLKQSYVAFSDSNSGRAVLRTYKKGAQVFINSEKLVNSPNNGIIYEMLRHEYLLKYAIFYNPKTMQFEQYNQKPLSEIQADYPEEYEGEDEPEEVVVADTITAIVE